MQCTLCICVHHEMLQVASKVSVYGKYGIKYDRFQGSKGHSTFTQIGWCPLSTKSTNYKSFLQVILLRESIKHIITVR